MEEIQGAVSLESRLKTGQTIEHRLIRSVGELLGRLHGEGLSHRDLKSSNIMLDGLEQPFLIDLDGLTFVRTLTRARVRADLGRFSRSVTAAGTIEQRQKVEFLRAYLRGRHATITPEK